MAEFPHPVRLWRDIFNAARYALNEMLVRFERRIRDEYGKPGPRDN